MSAFRVLQAVLLAECVQLIDHLHLLITCAREGVGGSPQQMLRTWML
jgi:hypothetical protein